MNTKFFKNTKAHFSNNLINIPGRRINRRIVVIESDDWGSIRMPSKKVYNEFISKGFNIADSDYNRLDTLESNTDLEALFEILLSLKDSKGRHPVMTANCIVGNPDFTRIKERDFQEYCYETVLDTIQRYPGRDKIVSLWKEGDRQGIFHPQFHGREHVNAIRWISALRKRSPEILYTFEKETTFSGNGDYNFMEVLDYNSPDDLSFMKESLIEGMDLFEELFGFRSKSFIPPCYTWDSNVEEVLAEGGVKYIQGIITQLIPTGTFEQYNKKYHFLGNMNKFGQYFLVRNTFFEPSLTKSTDPIGDCLRRINIAFRWKKPAIIGTHRINYMGELDESNRSKNLILLKALLEQIIQRWPDVEFMASDELGDIIFREKFN